MDAYDSVDILLAEDNDADAELTIHALRSIGIRNRIFHVQDGVEALAFLFREGRFANRDSALPKLVLLDIGMPMLELLDQRAELWVIELSSFQTGEAAPLELGVITSLYEEHLDWHGSRERYVADKLRLADVSWQLLVNALQPVLMERTAGHPHRLLFGQTTGWHVADGWIRRGIREIFPVDRLAVRACHLPA